MKVAIIGANGQLGADVAQSFAARGHELISLSHSDLELSSLESVRSCLSWRQPQVVINTAAMHHVENCEREPLKAYGVNGVGARNLAVVTRELGAKLVHISTDYVFDGAKATPYVETDVPLPLNVYGNTKLAGECFVRTINPKHFVLRTSALYGTHPCRAKGGRNFVQLMLHLGRERGQVRVVDSEFVSPTSTAELAEQIVALTDTESYGLYNATAEGSCSWFEFAREIFSASGLTVKVDVASAAEFPAKVARPAYSVLENKNLKNRGLNIFRPWQAGVRDYLSKIEPSVSAAPV